MPIALIVASATVAGVLSAVPADAATETLFGSTVPPVKASANAAAMTVGLKFTTKSAGQVTGARFYKGPGNSGTHVGALYSSSGTQLAKASFVKETASGWQTVSFSQPISVAAGATLTAAVQDPMGHYASSTKYAWPKANTNLTGVAGVYKYTSTIAFPSQTYNSGNYFVDVNFTPRAAGLNSAASSPTLPYWGNPVFADEFNGDLSKWNVRSRSTLGLLNDTAEVTPNAVTVSDGSMHIKATWKTTPKAEGPQGILTHDTGYVEHRKNGGGTMFAQRYGRWEVRAKVPTGQNTLGALPAFWLRNSNSGEIDVMESWGFGTAPKSNGQKDGTSTTTVHSHTGSVPAGQTYKKYAWTLEDELRKKGLNPTKAYDGFHVWAFEFTPTYAATILDGVEVFRATPATHPMLWDERFFGTPLHMRINLHVGPSKEFYGLPDPKQRQLTKNGMEYQIDHVRAWALPA